MSSGPALRDGFSPTLAEAESQELLLRWLEEFKRDHGRPLRVLHHGNIANNGYLNAKFLRAVGVDAHVMSSDFYHSMGTPEWEEIEVTHPYGSDSAPDFSVSDLGEYLRPDWFFYGTIHECLQQATSNALRALLLPAGGQRSTEVRLQPRELLQSKVIAKHLDTVATQPDVALSARTQFSATLSAQLNTVAMDVNTVAMEVAAIAARVEQIDRRLGCSFLLRWIDRGIAFAARIPWLRKIYRWVKYGEPLILIGGADAAAEAVGDAENLPENRGSAPIGCVIQPPVKEDDISRAISDFRAVFPTRPDQLKRDDVAPFAERAPLYRQVFEHYDLIQCYATDPVWGYLAGNRPYIGFEHGTLRTFTMADNSLCRLTALGYRKAAHSFVTNGDCLAYATALGLTDFSAMIHPIDVELHRRDLGEPASALKRRLQADVLLFCPLRHDWEVKGTDIHLRALPLIRASVSGRVVLALIRWGQELDKSSALIVQNGCRDTVVWLPPLSRISMVRLMRAADVVLDQMALPHFGATAPQALAAGTPVISSYKPESTMWIVAEPAPILPAFSPPDVRDAVMKAIDPQWRAEFAKRAQTWIDNHHHPNRLVTDHLSVYKRVLARGHDLRG